MHRRRLTALTFAAAMTAGGPWCLPVQAAAPASPSSLPASSETRRLVEEAAAAVLSILRDPSPADQKSQRASAIVEDRIDFPTFARLALGPAWNDMTGEQRDVFLSEFHKLVRSVFVEGIDQYRGQDAVVDDERQEPRGDRVIRVRIIDTRGGKRRDALGVDFRLRQFEGQWKAIDLTIAGISLAVTCRAQFAVFLRDGGVGRVIQVLQEKNAQRARDGGSGHGK